jgi:hypothetical protein
MGKHLKLEGMFLDDTDLKDIHDVTVHKVSNQEISIQTLAEVLDELNQYGRSNQLRWGMQAVEIFDPATVKKVTGE